MSDIISLRVSPEERQALSQIASVYGCSVSSIIRQFVFERLEDEYDMTIVADYEARKAKGELELRPIAELWEELGI